MTPAMLFIAAFLMLAVGVALDAIPLQQKRLAGEMAVALAVSLAAVYVMLAWAYGWPWPDWTALMRGLFGPLGRELMKPPE